MSEPHPRLAPLPEVPERDLTIRAPRQVVLYAFLGLLTIGQAGNWRATDGTGSEVSDLADTVAQTKLGQELTGQMLGVISRDVARVIDGQAATAASLAGIQAREAELRTRVESLERAVFSK